jgi:toxin ParE1/3/4
MTIRWRLSAVSDLANIRDYISASSPNTAHVVVERVLRSVDRLDGFPKSGRRGSAQGTFEVVVPGLPYIVVYTLDETDVDIVAVFHGARDRDPLYIR